VSAEGYAKALAAFQEALPNVSKGHKATAGTYSYTYADLTDVSAAVVPLLAKQGLAWSAKPTLTDAGFVLAYSLRHTDGHVESGEYPLPDPTKTPAQQLGSAITYARRYALTAITGVAPGGDDDDGAKAQEARSSAASKPARSDGNGNGNGNGQRRPSTEHAPTTPANVSGKQRAIAAGESLGMNYMAVVDDFASWSEGKLFRDASEDLMGQYVTYIEELASAKASA